MRILLMGTVFWLITGCAVAKPLPSAEVLSPTERAESMDARIVELNKDELLEKVSQYLSHYINEKVGLRVERTQISDEDSVRFVAVESKLDGALVLRVKELKAFVMGLQEQSMKVDLALGLSVFDAFGKRIYQRVVRDQQEKRFEISDVRPDVERFVEAVMKSALSQYIKDPELKVIIAKFKYGSLGGVIAQLF